MMFANISAEDGTAEARLIHPGQAGWFAIMRRLPNGKWMSKCHPLSMVECVAKAVQSATDVYISQASFSAPMRRLAYLSKLRSAWVDLDCYNLGAAPSQGFITEVVNRAVAAGLPPPTYVVRSGRGLYAKWIFEREVGASNLPVWSQLQATLVATFRALGADPRARDAARVLRTLGSVNSKAPEAPVQMAWTSGALVDFESLCLRAASVSPEVAQSLADPSLTARLSKQEQTTRLKDLREKTRCLGQLSESICQLDALDTYTKTREPIMLDPLSARALNWKRFLDLRTLAHMRSGVHRGSRDSFLFWMMTFLCNAHVVSAGNFWQELQCLSQFICADDFKPMVDGSMSTLFERVKGATRSQTVHEGSVQGSVYTASNAKLIDLLQITPDEQQHLSTIISTEEKSRRCDLRSPGRAARRMRLVNNKARALQMLDDHLPVQSIAKALSVDRRQIYRWKEARDLAQRRPDATSPSGRARAADLDSLLGVSECRRISAAVRLDTAARLRRHAHLEAPVDVSQAGAEAALQAAPQAGREPQQPFSTGEIAIKRESFTQLRKDLGLSESAMRRHVAAVRELQEQFKPQVVDQELYREVHELGSRCIALRKQSNALSAMVFQSHYAMHRKLDMQRTAQLLCRRFHLSKLSTATRAMLEPGFAEELLAAHLNEVKPLKAQISVLDQRAKDAFADLDALLRIQGRANSNKVCSESMFRTVNRKGPLDGRCHPRQPQISSG